jgi:hypothetical protein
MFSKTDNEVKQAINILESLINSKTTNALETIQRYKASKEIDLFTSYRLNRELKKLHNKI